MAAYRKNRNRFAPAAIASYMESLGWSSRPSTNGHIVLNKPNEKSITMVGNGKVRDASVTEVKRAIADHLRTVVVVKRGRQQFTKEEMALRVEQGQKLYRLGFDMAFIQKTCGLGGLATYGLTTADLINKSSQRIIDHLWDEAMRRRGVRITRPDAPEERDFAATADALLKNGSRADYGALIDLLSEVSEKVGQAIGPGHLANLGMYRERAGRTLIELRILRRNLEGILEGINRVIETLEDLPLNLHTGASGGR